MQNLDEQLQQLRLTHKRITTTNDANSTAITTASANGKNNAINAKRENNGDNIDNSTTTTRSIGNIQIKLKKIATTPITAAAKNQVQHKFIAKDPLVRWSLDGDKKKQQHLDINTLDNPIVLDQQLEALAHHKLQMERRGLLHIKSSEPDLKPISLNSKHIQNLNALDSSTTTQMVRREEVLFLNDASPPSPVSSSYSELRQAADLSMEKQLKQPHSSIENSIQINIQLPTRTNNYMNTQYGQLLNENTAHSNSTEDTTEYYDFGNFSQVASSTYESIYEPINPRPASQMSDLSRNRLEHCSNLSFYAHYANLPAINNELMTPTNNITKTPMSSADNSIYSTRDCSYETESLTDYLDRSMDISEGENYGNCCKCGEAVMGEKSGCTAMNQIYHIECFTCVQCQINLQGKPFYAIDNKAYCEYDYLQTLEKCSVCTKPILERILRATGKPYHPQCFTCIVCGKTLDGIPFTVDATNQNYCIYDFHKKFAPRCCVCKDPIMPESGEEETVRVVALDRSFHLKCYKCEDCGLLLSSNSEGRGCYPLDDHVLCKSCNAKRVQLLTNSNF